MEIIKNNRSNLKKNLQIFKNKDSLDFFSDKRDYKKDFLEGMNSFLLRSQFMRIVPSYPYSNYIKLYYNYKYQGIITGLYKDKLSGNLNLLIDLGLKEDLVVLKETYDRNIDFFRNNYINNNYNNVIAKLDIKQKQKISITNFEKNKISIYSDFIFEKGSHIRFNLERIFNLKLLLIKG